MASDPCAFRVAIARGRAQRPAEIDCLSCGSRKGKACVGIPVEFIPDPQPIPDPEPWPRHTGEA